MARCYPDVCCEVCCYVYASYMRSCPDCGATDIMPPPAYDDHDNPMPEEAPVNNRTKKRRPFVRWMLQHRFGYADMWNFALTYTVFEKYTWWAALIVLVLGAFLIGLLEGAFKHLRPEGRKW